MKKSACVFLLLILSGCGTVSQKAPDPFGIDLHHKMDFLEDETVHVVYPSDKERDSLGQYVQPSSSTLFN